MLFYGSALRDDALDGVLDFYVLLDRSAPGPARGSPRYANRLLPPNVGYLEAAVDRPGLRAKYAVMTLAQFRRGGVDAVARHHAVGALLAALRLRSSAQRGRSGRGARCGAPKPPSPPHAGRRCWGRRRVPAAAYWRALYQRTYAAELRVERSTRGADLLAGVEARYERLLPAAWRAAGLAFAVAEDGSLQPSLGAARARLLPNAAGACGSGSVGR